MNEISESIYRTADLALTAALCVSGFAVEYVEFENQRKLIFVFERTQRLNEVVEMYWRGELQVEPQTYFNQLKTLKARIYQH